MAVNVLIPTPLRNLTGGLDTVQSEAGDVTSLVQALEDSYPGLGNRLRTAEGALVVAINSDSSKATSAGSPTKRA